MLVHFQKTNRILVAAVNIQSISRRLYLIKLRPCIWKYGAVNQIDVIHELHLHKGFRFSSKDFQSIFWSWFVDFSDYALVFGIYAIPSSVHLLVSFIHEVKLSMHRWWVCTLHLQYTACMKRNMLVSQNVVSACKVLFVILVLCWPAASRVP